MPLRVERHCYNAQKVAEFLNAHEKVSSVNYAGLPSDKYHELREKIHAEGDLWRHLLRTKGRHGNQQSSSWTV